VPDWFRELDGGRLLLYIKAIPGASKTEPAGIKDARLRFRIAAAPEGGKANAELCAALSRLLGCTKKEITLQSGERSRLKTLLLPTAVRERLEQLGRDELKE
jgi:uncharacterized protein (TIGR00251 family)